MGPYIIFKYDSKYGVMNLNGKYIVEPKYNKLRYTAVSGVFRYEENYKFGLLNEKGEEFLNANYEFVSPEDKENIIVKEKHSYFLIDYKGKPISNKYSHRIFSYDSKSKIFIFELNQKYGYKRSNGNIVFDTIFNAAYSFVDGNAKIRKDANGEFGFVNDIGKVVVPPIYEFIYENGNFDGYFIRNKNHKYGLLNKKVQVLLKPQYDEIGSFNDGYAFVKKEGKYGFINENGKLIIQ